MAAEQWFREGPTTDRMAEALSRLWCFVQGRYSVNKPVLDASSNGRYYLLPNQLITPFTTPEWSTPGGSLPLLIVQLSASKCVFDWLQRRGQQYRECLLAEGLV